MKVVQGKIPVFRVFLFFEIEVAVLLIPIPGLDFGKAHVVAVQLCTFENLFGDLHGLGRLFQTESKTK
jgi:hypothetical protein